MESLAQKQQEFNFAIKRYEQGKAYPYFNNFISISNVSLQAMLIFLVLKEGSLSWFTHVFCFLLAYLMADFINGLIHMYMDNNENYNWIGGPLVAYFHLHHKRPIYMKRSLIIVYFNETGSKVWMLPVLLFFVILNKMEFSLISPTVLAFIMYFAILSSIAEVSHYICHTLNRPWSRTLGKLHILLSKKHHSKHHTLDNMNYAFLNGVSDPLINFIAKRIYQGYKKNTDLHFALYKISEIKSES